MATTGRPAADRDGEIDAICDRFEAAWKAGGAPVLGDFLDGAGSDADFGRRLRAELEAIDREYRRRAGRAGDPNAATAEMPTPARPGEVTLTARIDDLRFHARGGLGEIYRARDAGLHRDVAVKFVRPEAASADSQARFVVEAEITGRLDHPGVVPVYGLGQGDDGRPFIAMRFIEGRTLKSAIEAFHAATHATPADRRRDLHRLLGHLVAACNTVAYAHSRGILHRDIKPENIMIGRFHETLVVDWGLAVPIARDERARSSGEQTMHLSTESGGSASGRMAAGTVGYVSPEGTREGQPDIDARSDVYSLGATLYHLLVGRRAIEGPPDPQVLAAIRSGNLPAPRGVNPLVPRQLDAVCRKAMAADPAARHATPLALAADIEACIADEPVSCVRQTVVDRLRRAARSHRTAVAAALLGLVGTAVVGLASAALMRRQAVREHTAFEAADAANRGSLRLAASFAAQTVAGEIDVRWRILESLAADPALARLLVAAADRPDARTWPELQAWLASRQGEFADLRFDSWFLTDARGIQVARFPASPGSIGGDFSGRDYFHGRGFEIEGPDRPDPIRRPHISTSYVSTSDQRLKIAFTVPVWGADDPDRSGKPVGVLGISTPAGGFRILHCGLKAGQVGVLIDVRQPTAEAGPRQAGEVLHHPSLRAEQLKDIAAAGAARNFHVDADLVTRLQAVRAVRHAAFDDEEVRAARSVRQQEIVEVSNVIDGFGGVQPLDGPGAWLAAFEPVIIAGRPPDLRDTGLVVLVQQRDE